MELESQIVRFSIVHRLVSDENSIRKDDKEKQIIRGELATRPVEHSKQANSSTKLESTELLVD